MNPRPDRFRDQQARIAKALAYGIGGLKFVAQSPPGMGRLIRIPFYLTDPVARFGPVDGRHTGAQFNPGGLISTVPWGSTTHPVVLAVRPAATGGGNTALLRTPEISWAILRIVGFEVTLYTPVYDDSYPMELAVSDLKVTGGTSLFVHEWFAPASHYLAGADSFTGLRDYPVLQAPNICEVQAQVVGHVTSRSVAFGFDLVCEVLEDDEVGISPIQGPYARPGAMVRASRSEAFKR